VSKSSWRKALIAPVALALGLGGALFAATAANAADAGLTVTSPANNSTVASRTVTVSGSVFGGSTVIVYAADGSSVLARENVGGSFGDPTPYSLTLPAYADSAPVAQTIEVGGLYGGSGIPQEAVHFTLPAAATPFTVTSPTPGEAESSRTVTFTGTGTNGSTVNVLDTDGNRIPGTTAAVVSNGTWTTTGTYADSAPVAQTVSVNQVTGGAGRGQATVSFTLPAPTATFSVTSPTEGQTVASRTVTFTGTGTNGSTVNVLDTDGNRIPGTTAAVVSNGVWSTTGTYATDAPAAQTVDVNQVTGGAGRGEAVVHFTLPTTTPVTPVSPAGGTTGTTGASTTSPASLGSTSLADTGSNVTGATTLGAVLLAAGAAAVVVVSRRRRAA
jgi:LPXTG-motif cell wall-anchored protein